MVGAGASPAFPPEPVIDCVAGAVGSGSVNAPRIASVTALEDFRLGELEISGTADLLPVFFLSGSFLF